MKTLKIMKLADNARLPTRAHASDCGLDLYVMEGGIVKPGDGRVFKTGVAAEFPLGFVGMLTDRSSMAKRGFKVAGGIIDPGYTGELMVVLRNISSSELTIESGDRIAQLLMLPMATPEVVEVSSLAESARANNGFGSSGK